MEPILINPDLLILNEQYRFLIQREFDVRYRWHKKTGLYFLAWIGLLTGFVFFTDSEKFVTLKAVLLVVTALATLVAAAFSTIIISKWINRQRWKKKTIKKIVENKLSYWLSFDEAQISFSTETHSSNIKWEYYKYYKEHKDTIYIFQERIYEGIACSKTEIGKVNYDQLREVVNRKLSSVN